VVHISHATEQQKSTDIPCIDRHSIEPSPLINEVKAAVKELKQFPSKSFVLKLIVHAQENGCLVSFLLYRNDKFQLK
jgi:hypothetical protein